MVRLMELMGIIIFEVKYESNKCCFQELFLKELYPSGLVDDMLIGRLGFDCEIKFALTFMQGRNQPRKWKNWGIWGKKL